MDTGHTRSRRMLIALAGFAAVLAVCDGRPVDDAPGAELPHNIRLVYWDGEAVRADMRGEPIPTEPYVWRLQVPRKFLDWAVDDVRPDGRLPRPYRPPRSEAPFVRVSARMDPDTLEILPLAYPQGTDPYITSALLKPARTRFNDYADRCLPINYGRRVKGEVNYFCEANPNQAACQYRYEVDGWSLSMSVPVRLPELPSAYCDTIVDWLDSMTVHRDPLPTEGRPREWEEMGTLERPQPVEDE